MPLPLIPVAIVLVATSTGGVAAGADGVRRMSKAKSTQASACRRRAAAVDECEAAGERADTRVGAYGRLQLRVERDSLGAWARWLAENERKVRGLEGDRVDGVSVESIDLPALQAQAFEAERLLGGSVGAVLAGVAARQAALTGVRAIATASTGTAISGLSGAAANSAALAWLGGGTLATGGGGMAAGASVLTGVGIAPTLLVSGLSLNVEGHRALTRARKVEAVAAADIAQLKTQTALLGRVERRVDELSGVLHALDTRARDALDDLCVVDFDPQQHVELFMRTAQLMQSLREILSTPVLDTDGDLTAESELIVIKYQQSTPVLPAPPAN